MARLNDKNNSGDKDAAEKTPGDSHSFSWDDHFFGSVTIGERGQVVIPAEARKRFHLEPGDRLLVMGDPGKRSIMLCRIDTLREFMNAFQEGLAQAEQDMTIAAVAADASPDSTDDPTH
ncbi:MAG: AbrB/MazE/SpoVT family DNA-binding domain-containing protein, partial [Cytophagales bacterium]|nr:AbrB/MazE/SpoVT family DNA-binding domain-containing protein [Armatimonadota bacterium]